MKPTRQLVIGLTVFLSFSLFTMNCFATDVPISKSDTPTQAGQSRAPFRIPVTVSYTADEVNFNFIYSVGVATITITDEYGVVVYQEMVDTYSTSEVFIAADAWASANYTIKVSYGTTTLSSIFLVE